jgi:hypothetical protein
MWAMSAYALALGRGLPPPPDTQPPAVSEQQALELATSCAQFVERALALPDGRFGFEASRDGASMVNPGTNL